MSQTPHVVEEKQCGGPAKRCVVQELGVRMRDDSTISQFVWNDKYTFSFDVLLCLILSRTMYIPSGS